MTLGSWAPQSAPDRPDDRRHQHRRQACKAARPETVSSRRSQQFGRDHYPLSMGPMMHLGQSVYAARAGIEELSLSNNNCRGRSPRERLEW